MGRGGPFPHYIGTRVPTPVTFKSLGSDLLRQIGYSYTGKAAEWKVWDVLKSRLQLTQKTVLWLDEAHDLLCSDREKILRALKALMQGDYALILVLTGTEKLRHFVKSDPEVWRRFTVLNLPALNEAIDGANIATVISQYCQMAELDPPQEDVLPRLLHASNKLFGRCIEIILGAIECALEAGDDRVGLQHFAEFWMMTEGCSYTDNVFTAQNWAKIAIDQVDEELPSIPKGGSR